MTRYELPPDPRPRPIAWTLAAVLLLVGGGWGLYRLVRYTDGVQVRAAVEP